METIQQIILIILTFLVWIIGGITILITAIYITAYFVNSFWNNNEIMFFRYLCYLTFNAKSQNDKNDYYNKQYTFMWDEVKRQVEKAKLDLVIANKKDCIYSEQELITLLENALLENSKLAKHLLEKDKETQKLKDKVAEERELNNFIFSKTI